MTRGIHLIFALALCAAFSQFAIGQPTICEQAASSFSQRQWESAAEEFRECEDANPGKTSALLYQGKSLINLNRFDDAATALQAYLKQHPSSGDGLYSLAYVRFRQDQPRESLQVLNDASKVTPPAADDLKIAALDYVLLHDYNDAAKYLEQSLQMNPESVEARYHLGRVRYQLNQFDLAIAAFQQVLVRDPDNVKAEDNLGLSFEAKNQTDQAVAAYRKAIRLDQAASTHSGQPYLDLGALLAKENRGAEAVPMLRRATELDPSSGKAHYELAKALLNLGQVKEAQMAAETAARLEPTDSTYHYLLARIYQRLGNTDLAKQQFAATEDLIKKKESKPSTAPPDPGGEALRSEARDAAQQGDLEKALSLLLQARKLSPQDADVLYDLGMIALRMSLFSDAVQAFHQTLAIRNNDPNALYGLGRAQIGLTKYQDARDTFDHYLQLRPQDASGHYALGLALAALQLSADARKQFEASLALQPLQTESHFQLGLLDLENKQLEAAHQNFDRVLARDPRHAGALTGMGRLEFEEKHYAKAVDFLQRAIAADPNIRQPHYYLGLAYARMGQKDDSAKELGIAGKIEHDEAEKQRLGLKVVNEEQQ